MSAYLDLARDVWIGVAVHLWQTTLLLVPLFLLARRLRFAPARLVHAFWSLALLKLVFPAAALRSLADAIGTSLGGNGEGWSARALADLAPSVAFVLDPISAVPRTPVSGAASVFLIAGSVFWMCWVARGAWRLARRLRAPRLTLSAADGALGDKLSEALATTTVPGDRVMLVGDETPPCVTGLFRPRILLPERVVRALGPDEIRAVLLHENAHRSRRDPLRAVLVEAGTLLFFFYPPAALLGRRLRESAELVCDEAVLRAGIAREVYSRALARTISLQLLPAVGPSAAGVGGKSLLSERFRRIAAPGRYVVTRNHRALVVLAAVLLAAGMWTSFACSNDPAPSRQPSPAIDAESEEAPGMLYETPPSLIHMDQPVYPAEAKKAGVEGLVHVKVMIGRDGKVQDASVARSAGVESLDAAALEAARTCQFEPAKDASGAAVATWAQLPIKFALQ